MKTNPYDKLAFFYDLLAFLAFGSGIRKSNRVPFEDVYPVGKTMLIVAGGNGSWINEACRNAFKAAEKVVFLEPSGAMQTLARKNVDKLGGDCPMAWVSDDYFSWNTQEAFDVITAHFFLDCLPDPHIREFMAKAKRLLKKDGILVISDFLLKGTSDRWWNRLRIKMAYRFFSWTTSIQRNSLPDLESHFEKSGWNIQEKAIRNRGLICSFVLEPT